MKKLLLLALTVGTCASLAACGGSDKTVTNFLDRHINVENQNVTVSYNNKVVNIDGNMVENTTDNTVFDMDLSGKTAAWLPSTYYEYTPTGDTSYTTGYKDIILLDSLTETELKSVDNAAYQAYVGPFAQLAAAQSTVLGDNELSYKNFKSETVKNDDNTSTTTYYFVVDKDTTSLTSPMTIEFSFELNDKEKATDVFETATVKYNSATWTYSNLTNRSEDVKEEDVANEVEVATPATTLFEELAIAAQTIENMQVTTSIPYTDTEDTTITSQTITLKTSTTTEGVQYFQVSTQFEGSYYAIELEDGTFQVYTKCTIASYTNYYIISNEATLPHVDAVQTVLTERAVKAEELEKVSGYYSLYYTENDIQYRVNGQEFKYYGGWAVTLTDTSGDSNVVILSSEDFTTDLSSTVAGLAIYNTVLADYTTIMANNSSNTVKNNTVEEYDADGVLVATYYYMFDANGEGIALTVNADGTASLTNTYTGSSTGVSYNLYAIDADMVVTQKAGGGGTNTVDHSKHATSYIVASYSELTYNSTTETFVHNYGETSHKAELHVTVGETLADTYGTTYRWSDSIGGVRVGEYVQYITTVNSADEVINTYLAAIESYEVDRLIGELESWVVTYATIDSASANTSVTRYVSYAKALYASFSDSNKALVTDYETSIATLEAALAAYAAANA
ncbi:MAG: DUF1565 domain-containing protein [bacterium]